MNLGKYAKFIVAILGALVVALEDNILDLHDVAPFIIAAVTAAGVYLVPNQDDA